MLDFFVVLLEIRLGITTVETPLCGIRLKGDSQRAGSDGSELVLMKMVDRAVPCTVTARRWR
jgi:hypothetical protein